MISFVKINSFVDASSSSVVNPSREDDTLATAALAVTATISDLIVPTNFNFCANSIEILFAQGNPILIELGPEFTTIPRYLSLC
jgi:hypothetical protein